MIVLRSKRVACCVVVLFICLLFLFVIFCLLFFVCYYLFVIVFVCYAYLALLALLWARGKTDTTYKCVKYIFFISLYLSHTLELIILPSSSPSS
jgi:hypothetical protein